MAVTVFVLLSFMSILSAFVDKYLNLSKINLFGIQNHVVCLLLFLSISKKLIETNIND